VALRSGVVDPFVPTHLDGHGTKDADQTVGPMTIRREIIRNKRKAQLHQIKEIQNNNQVNSRFTVSYVVPQHEISLS